MGAPIRVFLPDISCDVNMSESSIRENVAIKKLASYGYAWASVIPIHVKKFPQFGKDNICLKIEHPYNTVAAT